MAQKVTVKGFTLLEVVIAMVVVSILAVIAFPSYVESVRKGRRSDAMAALKEVQQAQERHRANNATYASTLAALNVLPGARSHDGHYIIAISDASPTTYTITANVAAGSPQASDSRCAMMRLRQDGGQTSYESTSGGSCWSR